MTGITFRMHTMWRTNMKLSSGALRRVVVASSKARPFCRARGGSFETREILYSYHGFGSTSTAQGSAHELEVEYDKDNGIATFLDSFGKRSKRFQTVIGLELHAQLKVPTKLFSLAPTKHSVNILDNTASSSSSHSFSSSAAPNTLVHAFDMGYPGSLPLLSCEAVQAAVLASSSMECHIHSTSRFERKHYHYPDLPCGYQITQQRWPIASDGLLQCRLGWNIQQRKRLEQKQKTLGSSLIDKSNNAKGKFFHVGIERIQLEQDTGKTTSVTVEPSAAEQDKITRGRNVSDSMSLIDLNRAGSALIEIVSRPDIRSAHEAAACVATIQQLLRHLNICDGEMESGSLRCDLNISIAPLSSSEDSLEAFPPRSRTMPQDCGKRVEVKNLNSIRQVIAATEYEVCRQGRAFLDGEPSREETRTFDPLTNKTRLLRTKEGAVDYRFMPEPDVPPILLDRDTLGGQTLEQFLDTIPEIPQQVVERLMTTYGLSEDMALILVANASNIPFYEDAVRACVKESFPEFTGLEANSMNESNTSKQMSHNDIFTSVANWMCNDLLALIKNSNTSSSSSKTGECTTDNDEAASITSIEASTVSATQLGQLVALVLKEDISTLAAKKTLKFMFQDDNKTSSSEIHPRTIINDQEWTLLKDPSSLKVIAESVVHDTRFAKQLQQYQKGGKHSTKMEKFFFGQAMSQAKGNAHPQLLQKALQEVLEKTLQ